MHVLYEMFSLCAPCPYHLLSCSLVASSPTRGNPVTGSPHLSSCSARPRHLFLLHRSLNELPEPRCCVASFLDRCHGTLSFHHGDECFLSLLLTFNKNCINLIMSSASR